ncbi:MAG: hypothetical protein ACP5XB_23760 [Isosphaeraceae bacterium]
MKSRHSVSFRPDLQHVEDRFLATVHPLVSHAGLPGLAGQAHAAAVHPLHSGHIVMMAGGGSRQQGLPANYHDWGLISIWNTTNQRLTFSVAASTFQNGRYFNFTLPPRGYQVYYATYDSSGNQPYFNVSFDPIHRTNAIQISDINTVFQRRNYYPWMGTEGRPYAIASGVSGLYLTPI